MEDDEVVAGSRSKSQPHLAKSLSSFVGTYLASTLFLSLLPPCPPLALSIHLSLSFSLMSGMLRPRHALIGDGLRRPTTAAYARTQLGKCGGSWVVPEYGFLARCRVVALLQATVIRAVLPPTSTTTTTQGWVLPLPTFLPACMRS